MKITDCSSYGKCSAPICPISELADASCWFPDEEICTQQSPSFIKVQRKITSRAKDVTKFFTLKMLNRNCIIGKAITGLDPDKGNYEEQETAWLQNHRPKRKLTEEEKAKKREFMQEMRARKGA